ncbi:SPOR domain-containing protein [Hydrogenophaga sp. PAMC20947]|uniref:SPOR domain-containing protein n=1 Tax=Hydrogenophaga sp. PAMC20947 TaxID=2565558 RepID=UPI00109E362D|nr:SPOR domain-containing protein [Hydrogenophaga sp. PAMC20947]QCB46996.1 SPOR domain-containing protein [Hydrogenophaga sp. PAMC20947]
MILTPDQPDPDESSTARLYRATLGDASAGRYLRVFARFDDQGMADPTWNSAAALFHLGWLVHHRLWLSFAGCAAFAAAVALAITGLWQMAPGWPAGIKLGASLAMAMGAMLVPGLWGTAWLHTRSRRRMIRAVELAATVDGACATLSAEARDRQRRNTWGLAGLLSAGVLAALLWQTVPWATFAGGTLASLPEPTVDSVAAAVPGPAVVAVIKPVSSPPSATAPATLAKGASDVVPGPLSDRVAVPAALQAPAAQTAAPTLSQASARVLERTPVVQPEVPAKPVAPIKSTQLQTSASPPSSEVTPERAKPASVMGGASPAKALPKSAARSPAPADTEPASALVPVSRMPGNALATTAPSPSSQTVRATVPAAATATSTSTEIRTRVKGFGVAVGMFAVADNAEKVASQLAQAGLPVLSDPVDSARGRLTRVRVGPFDRREQAETAAAKVKALGLEARVYTP